MNNNILEIKELNKSFKGFFLNNISFSLPKGFIMGLIGPNGAGKTTIIKLILNMLNKNSGNILIFNKDNILYEKDIKEKIGIVMDKTYFVEEWKLGDIDKVLNKFYKNWNSIRYYKALSNFGLDKNKKVKELSSGMKMKLQIAAALSHSAKLLILDEPTSGLDVATRTELLEILSDFIINEDQGVLFSTHITSDLEKTSDYITFIKDGKVGFTGTKEALLEKYTVVKGNPRLLTNRQKEYLIGYREHSVGFDALAQKADLSNFNASFTTEKANLDEITLRLTMGGAKNE